MRTEVVKNIANEAIYRIQYYKSLHLTHKKINKIIFISFTIMITFLIEFLVCYYLRF